MQQLYHGDCLEVMKKLDAKSIDMILCDLPYGITARNKWDEVIPFEPLWKEYNRITKDNAAIVLFGAGMFTAKLMMSNPKMWRYNLIWEKTQPTGFLNANRMPLRSHEDICVFYKKLPTYNPQKTTGHERKVSKATHKVGSKLSTDYGVYGFADYDSTERFPRSILEYPEEMDSILTCSKDTQQTALHPTQKPVALLEWLIRTYTNGGATILDNCMGSGSTGVACMNTGRNFIGIELDPEYYSVALKRINNKNRSSNDEITYQR